jgi:hypothetical protein
MTLTDFLNTVAQVTVFLLMIIVLAKRKDLTTAPITQPVKVHSQSVVEQIEKE